MINYLKLEYQKWSKNAVITMLLGLFIILNPTVILIGREIPPVPPILITTDVFFQFPTVWDWMGFAGNWLVFFFLGFVSVHIVTSEVSNKTMRQSIINGQTRKEFFLSKLTVILALSVLATLYYVICTFLIGWFNTDNPDLALAFENEWAIPRYFLMCIGYMSLGLMLGIVIRSPGIAVLSYWSYILFLELLLRWQVHYRLIKNESMNYYPANAIEDLQPFPFYKFARFIPQSVDYNFLLEYNTAMIMTIIYSTIFLFLGYWYLSKKDM